MESTGIAHALGLQDNVISEAIRGSNLSACVGMQISIRIGPLIGPRVFPAPRFHDVFILFTAGPVGWLEVLWRGTLQLQ